MSNVIPLHFPNDLEEVEAVSEGLAEAVAKKEVKAVVIVSIQQGPNDKSPSIRIRHGWGDESVSAYDLLALASGVKHAELMVHGRLETPNAHD